MHKVRLTGACALGAALWLTLPNTVRPHFGVSVSMAQTVLRPAVGKPLAKAKSLLASRQYAAATAQVNIAAKQKGLTPDEDFVIEEMRGAIAQASGDLATASKVFAQLIASGRISGSQLITMLEAETSLSYQAKDYPGTISWAEKYFKAGGKDPAIHTLVIQAYYLQNDYANAAVAQQQQIDTELSQGKTPPEDQLQLLAACQKQTRDSAGLTKTMEQLVTYYPKPSYWADLVYALETSPNFSDRLELDLDRLKLRLGTLTAESDFMQMTQLALGENDPGEAQSIIAAANAQHVFGAPAQAPREQRLTALVNSSAKSTQAGLAASEQQLRAAPATTGDQLFELGQNYASFKQYDKGVGLMQEAIAKGDLHRPELAQLRVGEALVDAGEKDAAIAAFQKVPATTDGISGLAQLWLLWLKTQPTLQAG
jgi:tetratricopeptide (TPR) repeat protein